MNSDFMGSYRISLSSVMFAGHGEIFSSTSRFNDNSQPIMIETTASTITWVLWEMAKQPKIQTALRTEIRDFLRAAHERGEDTIPVAEYDKMPYTQAILKVIIHLLTRNGDKYSCP